MSSTLALRRAVRCALLSGSAALAAAPVNAADQQIQEIIVTGSRIASPNLESVSPVTAISREEIASTGKVRIEDIVNQLPQAFAAQGSSISNASDGTATVNLRGLGSQRTLVLVNGRRLMPGDPDGGSAADLNQIPSMLVQRVDVLTGGASSVYGADAVAGVVNFIMDTEFEGVRIDANYGWYNHRNDNPAGDIVRARGFSAPPSSVNVGYSKELSFALGVGGSDDRGHATFYATYRDVDPVLQSSYDYSACTLNSSATNPDALNCGGSQASDPAGFIAVTPSGSLLNTATCPAGGCIVDQGGSLRPFNVLTDAYNFGPINYYQRPDERYSAGVFADFAVSDFAEVYAELMFMDDRSVSQVAPSGDFGAAHQINCDNPLMSPAMVQEFCTNLGLGPDDFTTLLVLRRNTEGGGRQSDFGHESYRTILGLRGDISPDWRYDAYFQHGRTKLNRTDTNYLSITRTDRALRVRNDGNGAPQCISALDGTDPSCVPWDIWRPGGVTQQALAYLQTPGFIRAQAQQQIAHFDVSGDLSKHVALPTASSGLALNIGAEYRDERTEFRPDAVFQSGDLAGSGGATLPVTGEFNVQELFLEAGLPLLEDKPFASSLALEGGYRYSDYSVGFETDTYKAGLSWAPVEQLRFRASYQRAVRAPNVGELFSSQSVALDGATDPCAGNVTAATAGLPLEQQVLQSGATFAQCRLTGMTASQFGNVPTNPAAQYNGLLGGNPDLEPETSDTTSLGLVFRPEFADLTVALDYFDITVEGAISSVTGGNADVYINECLATGASRFCDLIQRDSLGSLWLLTTGYVIDTSLNLGELATRGVDVQADYEFDLGEHRLSLGLIGTYLLDLSVTPLAGGDSFDCTGLFGNNCTVPNPKWRHSLTTGWRMPWMGLDVEATWRYFHGVDSELTSSDPQLAGLFSNRDAHLSSRSYVDLVASVTFAESYTLRLGANNLLDKDPPIVSSGARGNCPTGPCNGNTWSQVYDTLGRQWFASLTVEF